MSDQSFNIRFFRVIWRESGNDNLNWSTVLEFHATDNPNGLAVKRRYASHNPKASNIAKIYIYILYYVHVYIYTYIYIYVYKYIYHIRTYTRYVCFVCVVLSVKTAKIDNSSSPGSNIKENWLAHRLDWGEWLFFRKCWQDERWLNPGCLLLDLRICSSTPIMMVTIFHYTNLGIINQVPTLCSKCFKRSSYPKNLASCLSALHETRVWEKIFQLNFFVGFFSENLCCELFLLARCFRKSTDPSNASTIPSQTKKALKNVFQNPRHC